MALDWFQVMRQNAAASEVIPPLLQPGEQPWGLKPLPKEQKSFASP